ncbi:hypothetical protein AQUCO_04100131v1 [Aquilegia coerulea]|uniref:Uncharacterized protein n=1 Tax=Aquilegia coerulea TaxID=218851 RepID=A0A2G5CQC4_AQUCA|nr:hypothetical protein AQUCO_04100131v1 [Aquilegia coerulea]
MSIASPRKEILALPQEYLTRKRYILMMLPCKRIRQTDTIHFVCPQDSTHVVSKHLAIYFYLNKSNCLQYLTMSYCIYRPRF